MSPAKVTDMKEYVHQTIGSTASLVKVIALFSTIAAFGTASLMLMMFLHMLRAKDLNRTHLLRTIGFLKRFNLSILNKFYRRSLYRRLHWSNRCSYYWSGVDECRRSIIRSIQPSVVSPEMGLDRVSSPDVYGEFNCHLVVIEVLFSSKISRHTLS